MIVNVMGILERITGLSRQEIFLLLIALVLLLIMIKIKTGKGGNSWHK